MIRTGALLVVAIGSAAPRIAAADAIIPIHHTRPPVPDTCELHSDAVGHRRCAAHGPWGVWGAALEAPYVFVGVGVNLRTLPRAPSARPATTPGVAARAVASPTPTPTSTEGDTSLGYMMRIGFNVARPLYLGFEAEIGPTDVGEAPAGRRALGAGMLGIAGLHGGSRLLVLSAELAGGGRVVETAGSIDLENEAVAEARARVDVWLTPWVTLGGAIGASQLHRGEWFTGLYLGVHTHSFAGNW